MWPSAADDAASWAWEPASCDHGPAIEARVVTPEEWRVRRRLRLTALAETPAAFGSTFADWSGPGDTEQRWRARLTIPAND